MSPVATQSATEPLSHVPRPPGLDAPSPSQTPGVQAVVRSSGVQEAIVTDTASQMAQNMERAALLSGTIEKNFKTIRAEVEGLMHTARRQAGDMVRVVKEGYQEGYQEVASARRDSRRERNLDVAQRATSNPQSFARRPGMEGQMDSPVDSLAGMTFAQGRSMGANIGELRRYSSNRLNQWMSQRQPNMPTAPPYRYNDEGYLTYTEGRYKDQRVGGGRAGGKLEQAESEMADFGKQMTRYGQKEAIKGTIQGAVSAFGEGGGLSGALGMLGKRAGPIGLAVGAGATIANTMESQREANRYYQQISGGSNLSGFAERGREMLFGLGGIGTMGQGQARDLFRQVSALGVTGGTREGALDFATEQFRKTGTDISVSMDLIRQSIANGVEDFTSLQSALDQVSKTARESGQNVSEAQKRYASTFTQVSQSFSNTAAAPAVAGALTSAASGQGRALSSLDYTGMLGMQSLTMQAAALGVNPLTYRAQASSGTPAGLRMLGAGMQTQIEQVAQTAFSPGQRAQATRMVRGMDTVGGALTPEQADRIGRAMGIQPEALLANLQARGVQGVTLANVYEFAGKMAVGGVNIQRDLNKQARSMEDKGREFSKVEATSIGGKKIISGDRLEAKSQDSKLTARLGYEKQMIAGRTGGVAYFAGLSGEHKEALETYQERLHDGGKRSKAIEELLKKGKVSDDTRIQVQTKDGPRQVTLAEAVRDYADQLKTGRSTITEGAQQGQTVGSITGMTREGRAKSESEEAKSGKKDVSKPSGSVQIYPSPLLEKLLRFETTGGAYLNDAGRAGVPASAWSPVGDRPDASGAY